MLKRLSAVLLASCLAMPVMTASVNAESQARPKKTFNFNSGSSSSESENSFWSQRKKRAERRARNREEGSSFNFMDRSRGFFSRSGDFFGRQVRWRNSRRWRDRMNFSDDSGQVTASTGEKYHTYQASYPVPLASRNLKQPKPKGVVFASASGTIVDANDYVDVVKLPDPVAQAIFEALKHSTTGVSLAKDQTAALIKAYAKREFAPIWIVDGKPSCKRSRSFERAGQRRSGRS